MVNLNQSQVKQQDECTEQIILDGYSILQVRGHLYTSFLTKGCVLGKDVRETCLWRSRSIRGRIDEEDLMETRERGILP